MTVSTKRLFMQKQDKKLFTQGGPGSGFAGHRGRIGKVGGSSRSATVEDIVSGKGEQRKEVSATVGRIPEGGKRGINSIEVSDKEGESTFGGIVKQKGAYYFKERRIVVYANAENASDVVTHEIGHNIHNQLIRDYGPEGKQKWKSWEKLCKRRYRNFEFVSGYDSFREHPSETFSEVYRIYNSQFSRNDAEFHNFLAEEDNLNVEKPFFDMLKMVGG